MKPIYFFIMLFLSATFSGCAVKKEKILIETAYGNIKIRLYDETPQHRDNFLKLVKQSYYDDQLFHRVINGFMIQGGDPNSKDAPMNTPLGNGDPGYTIDAEIVYPQYFHKKGALAAARQSDQTNPEKKSSGSQFYLVQGKVFTPEELDQFEKMMSGRQQQAIMMKHMDQFRDSLIVLQQQGNNEAIQQLFEKVTAQAAPEMEALTPFKFAEEHRQVYTTLGGTPQLDNAYTVFGEVEEGLEVIDRIAREETNEMDRPLKNISMTVRIIKE